MDVFRYDSLREGLERRKRPVIREKNYYAIRNGKAFWQISPVDPSAQELNGWKFHLSVAPHDVARAWDLIQETIISQRLSAKVTTPEYSKRFGDLDNPQKGKMITLYDDNARQRNWQMILQNIEDVFARNGVRPGPLVDGDRSIEGSRFISYRNDLDRQGHYRSSRSSQSYNDAGHADPHHDLALFRPGERRSHSNMPTEADARHLNALMEPVRMRFAFGLARGSTGWQIDEGLGKTGVPNVRVALSNRHDAAEIATALTSAGVRAETAKKGRSHLVMVMDDGLAALNPDRFRTAQCHLLAFEARDEIARYCHAALPPDAWQVDAGKGGVGVPNVRAELNSADQARDIADQVHEATGLDLDCWRKTLPSGATQHMVVLPISEPRQVRKQLDGLPRPGPESANEPEPER